MDDKTLHKYFGFAIVLIPLVYLITRPNKIELYQYKTSDKFKTVLTMINKYGQNFENNKVNTIGDKSEFIRALDKIGLERDDVDDTAFMGYLVGKYGVDVSLNLIVDRINNKK